MYCFIQNVSEFKIKDLLFKRYSNVNELLKTFSNFKELTEYLVTLIDKSVDEEIYEFYIHKSLFSEISYLEFKNEILKSDKKVSEEVQEDILKEAFSIVDVKGVE